MTDEPRFLADEMLGKLARDLRALGYDAAYVKHVEDDELLERARAQARLLLTRDVDLADRAGEQGIRIEAREPAEQLARLIALLDLAPDRERFLTRCLDCNVDIEPTDASEEVPASVRERQHWRCPACEKVYWLGSHAHDMLDRLGEHLPAEETGSDG